jgi:hypothetical protein
MFIIKFIKTTITQVEQLGIATQHKGKPCWSRHKINNNSQTLNMGPIILNAGICKSD